ncbi:MAG TPA: hypothetical protein VET87_24855 [Rubrivivax sp.]|nr:hypothetical protein [Rubrivivax sp.]
MVAPIAAGLTPFASRSGSSTPSNFSMPAIAFGLGDDRLRHAPHGGGVARTAVLEHGDEDAQFAHLQVPGQSLDQVVGRHGGGKALAKAESARTVRSPPGELTSHYRPITNGHRR